MYPYQFFQVPTGDSSGKTIYAEWMKPRYKSVTSVYLITRNSVNFSAKKTIEANTIKSNHR